MARMRSTYSCTECGHAVGKWVGKCPGCESWNSMEKGQRSAPQKQPLDKVVGLDQGLPRLIREVEGDRYQRYQTGNQEFDRVMGDGVTRASLTLIGGEPGIGKSTLLMEICGKLAKINKDFKLLYVSGEESTGQIASRCTRLGVDCENLYILNETNWQLISKAVKELRPQFFVLDSIQTSVSSDVNSAAGSLSQVREVTYEVMNYAKALDLTCFVIGHVTKEGSLAGPKVLEHMVDTVLYFEGDENGEYRFLRPIKNRFGSINEVGIFEMDESGLREVPNPSQSFINSASNDSYGRSLTCVLEGSRPIFVEVQALVVENKFGNGRRTTQGLESNRLALLVAVIEKYFEIPLSFQDIYLNVVGGLKLSKRESDLSVIASLLSSYKKHSLAAQTIFIGEVGLTGEVRPAPSMESRLKEIEQLNYRTVITDAQSAAKLEGKFQLELLGIQKAYELEGILFGHDVGRNVS